MSQQTTGPATGSRRFLRRLTAAYAWLLQQLVVITLTILIVPVTMQIFSRYTDLIPSYIWTEEMARLLFIWTIMLGAMLGIREGTHFEVDVWPKNAIRLQAITRIVSRLAVLVIALVFVWGGIEFTKFAWNRISELAELPLWLIHIAWPIAGVTWIIFIGEHMIDDLRALKGGEP
jgi:TRAP-type C4-dicarboxylate transport system permease small subunit